MRENICEYEQSVLKNLKSEKPDPELVGHLAGCSVCQESVKVRAWLQAFAATAQPKSLPKPGFIRWKAQIREKQARAERAAKPLVWAKFAAILLTLATVVWLLVKNQTPFEPVLKILSVSLELVALPMLIGFVCAAVVCSMFIYNWRDRTGKK